MRLPLDWDQRADVNAVSIESRLHLLAMIAWCSHNQRHDGWMPRIRAERCSDVANPSAALDELLARRLVIADAGRVQVAGMDEFLPPLSERRKKAERIATHVLYRMFGADGQLLYVGRTNDVKVRLSRHAQLQPWWPEVARTETTNYESAGALAAAEVSAIRAERPKYNVVHNLPHTRKG